MKGPIFMKNPKNILITGASSGIGQEIALLYAKAGINLVITGRDKKRLLATATTLEKKLFCSSCANIKSVICLT